MARIPAARLAIATKLFPPVFDCEFQIAWPAASTYVESCFIELWLSQNYCNALQDEQRTSIARLHDFGHQTA